MLLAFVAAILAGLLYLAFGYPFPQGVTVLFHSSASSIFGGTMGRLIRDGERAQNRRTEDRLTE